MHVAQLGTFSNDWDRMVQLIATFKLADKQTKALDLISAYMVDYTAVRNKAIASGDFQSMRTVAQEYKTKLDDGLKPILSEEQMAKWTEATAARSRRGGGRGGQGGQGGQGQ
jgi:hypothetical protein